MIDTQAREPSAPETVYFDSIGGDQARDVLNRFYHPVSAEGDLKLGVEVIQLGPLTVGHLTFAHGASMSLSVPAAYHLTLPTTGHVQARVDGREMTATPATALAFRPGDRVQLMHQPNTAELDVRIESWALEAELAALLGHPIEGPIDLCPVVDLTGGPAHSWSRLLRLLRDELEHECSLVHQPLIAEQLCANLLSGLLLSVPHRFRDELVAPVSGGPPRPIQRVLEAISDEPERPFTVSQMAAIGGMSIRSLQSGFRRHIGSAPMAHLQQIRLTRAHEALRDGDPSALTVADVAHRWGFAHLGRFASAYRKRFGESPSETLRATT